MSNSQFVHIYSQTKMISPVALLTKIKLLATLQMKEKHGYYNGKKMYNQK